MSTHTRLAKNLLDQQEKKLTVDIPSEIHRMIKSIAGSEGVAMKDLVLEALTEYTIPKYRQEVK